jgi:hypothetical protein
MIALYAIVKLTFKSVLRSHIFQILLALLLFTIIALPVTLVGDGTALAQIQISLQYCLGAVSFILSLSTIWLSCFAMSNDIETYQIHMLISKPVSRVTIWFGKALGILIIHTFLLFLSAGLIYILILCQFKDRMFLRYVEWPLGIIMVLSGVVLIFSAGIWINKLSQKFFKLKTSKHGHRVYSNSTFLLKTTVISFAVLIIAFLSFFAMNWQFDRNTFSLLARDKIRNEVLVGRRVYMPQLPDMKKRVGEVYGKMVKNLPANRRNIPAAKKREIRNNIYKQLILRRGEVRAGSSKFWSYKGLDPHLSAPVFLRYRAYVGKVSSEEQRETYGLWGARFFIPVNPSDKKSGKSGGVKAAFGSLTPGSVKIMGGVFNETILPPDIISSKGESIIGFTNFDPQRKTIFFQKNDGPQLLVKVTGFIENYIRGIFIIFLKLLLLTGFSCAIGGLFSASVAIFSVISYLLVGVFSTYLINFENEMIDMGGPPPVQSIQDIIGGITSKGAMLFIIPMQNFEISSLLSGGELIEYAMIGKLILFNLLLKGIPFIILGIFLYQRREMGLVIKK